MSCSAFSSPVSMLRGNKCIIMQSNDYYEIDLNNLISDYNGYGFTEGCNWNIERLIWIGFIKNDENDICLFNTLGKDVIKCIIQFLRLHPPTVHFSLS